MDRQTIERLAEEQQEEFQDAAMAIGTAVILFSSVEFAVAGICNVLLTFFGLRPQQAELVEVNLGLRENARIVVGLAHQAKLEPEMLKRIEAACNTASIDLRNRRNRIAHDSWSISEAGMVKRLTTGTKIIKQPLQLFVPQHEPVNEDEIMSFIADCEATMHSLTEIWRELIDRFGSDLFRAKIGLSPRPTGVWTRLLRSFGIKQPHPDAPLRQ